MGDKFPLGRTPVYPPRDWTCPKEYGGCGKYHGKPHFPWPGQIDEKKKPGETGRIVFNRVKGDNWGDDSELALDHSIIIKKELIGKQAPMYDKKGNPLPLMCPHCGYTHEGLLLIRAKERKEA